MRIKQLKLTPMEETVLWCLMCRPSYTAHELVEVLYPNPNTQPDCALKSLHVRIHRIKKKIAAAGWTIKSHCYRGYSLVELN